MAEFTYKTRTATGAVREGTIQASTRGEALDRLAKEDQSVLALKEKKAPLAINIPFLDNILHKIKLRDKIIFTRNLGGMLTSGLPIYRAMSVLERQAKNPQFETVLQTLMKTIHDGGSLSDGLKKFPKIFPPFFSAMVRAGEESGGLPDALSTIGDYLQKSYELQRKVKGAMIYPAVIISVVGLVGILMFIFVVPTLVSMFSEIGSDLPKSTQVIVWLSDTMQANGVFVILGLFAVGGGLVYASKSPKLQPYFHKSILRIPMIKDLVKEINTARTARTLSSLLSSGVTLTRALTITEEVLQHVDYKQVLHDAGNRVEKGVSLAEVFAGYPKLYPPMMSEMMEVGEETGNLSQMLLDIGIFYEEEVEAKTKNLSTIIEPFLMVIIGGAVGFFAVSMIQPMYSVLENF